MLNIDDICFLSTTNLSDMLDFKSKFQAPPVEHKQRVDYNAWKSLPNVVFLLSQFGF